VKNGGLGKEIRISSNMSVRKVREAGGLPSTFNSYK